MPAISNSAIITVNNYALREELTAALEALKARITRKYQDRGELVSLLQTGDPMDDQAAEESDDVQAIVDEIAELRVKEGEMARFLQMTRMHTRDVIEVSHEMLDTVLELANEVREVEAKAGAEGDVQYVLAGKD